MGARCSTRVGRAAKTMTRRHYSCVWLAALALLWPAALPGVEPPVAGAFRQLASLAGDWSGVGGDGVGFVVSYDLVADGSALRELLTIGTQPTMVSLYYPTDDRIMMTHYCLNRSQSRMRTRPIAAVGHELQFEYLDATNVMQATDGVMNTVRFQFQDPQHFVQTWTSSSSTDKPAAFHYARIQGARPPGFAHHFDDVQKHHSRAFARLLLLVGDWSGKLVDGDLAMTSRFQIVSGGNALMETCSSPRRPGATPMVTMYHEEGARLMLTHFCAARSQPRMETSAVPADPQEIDFKYKDATNVLRGMTSYMNHLTVHFQDTDHFLEIWNQDSKDQYKFAMTRLPASGGAKAR